MTIVTSSRARQNFSALLALAAKEGEVLVAQRGGKMFSIQLVHQKDSPLDVKGVRTGIATNEIVAAVRASRRNR